MERHPPELKSLRQINSREAFRRSSMENVRSILEHSQPPRRQIARRSQANGCVSEFRWSTYSTTCEEISEKIASFYKTPITGNEEPAFYGSPREFSNDFMFLLNNPDFSDVEIKCGSEVIKAHKNILASRSPVFKAMFSNPMVENTTGVVMIDDLDSQVIHEFLVFIYGNKVRNLSLMKACGLLEASTKYQVEILKDICVNFLIVKLTEEHALLILQKADLYDEKLKRFAISYICEKFSDLRKTEEWLEIQKHNPVLALEVCNCVIDRMSLRN